MPTENGTQQQQTSATNGGAGSQSSGSQSSAASSAEASRPEWLPESYWDAEKKAPKADEVTKHLTERNDLVAFKAAEDSRRAAVPEDPAKYDLKLPPDWKPPEGVEKFELDKDDPRWGVLRQVAKEAGVDQAGFEKIAGIAAAFEAQNQLAVSKAVEAQMRALGPKAQERIDAVKTFVGAKAGPQFLAMVESTLRHKDFVEGWEKLLRAATSGGQSTFTTTGRESGKPDPAEGWNDLPVQERTGARGFARALQVAANGASGH
jgi:hypothetical protein